MSHPLHAFALNIARPFVASYVVGAESRRHLINVSAALGRAYARLTVGRSTVDADVPAAIADQRAQLARIDTTQASIRQAAARARRQQLANNVRRFQCRQGRQALLQRRAWAQRQTVATLRRWARAHGVPGASKARKVQLIAAYVGA